MSGSASVSVETPAVVGRVSCYGLSAVQLERVKYVLGETFGSIYVRDEMSGLQRYVVVTSYHRGMTTKKMQETLQKVLENNLHHHGVGVTSPRP